MSISLKLGKAIKIDGEDFLIQEYSNTDSLVLRRFSDNRLFIFSIDELMNKLENNQKQMDSTATSIPYDERLLKIATRKFTIIKDLLDKTPSRREIYECASKHGVHPATIYRWIREYKKTGSIFGLIPNYEKRGCRTKRLDDAIENIIEQKIKNLYLSYQKLQAKVIYEEIKRECMIKNLKPPHYNTVLKKINKINKTLAKEKREGHLSAKAVSPVVGEFQAKAPLEILQVDHTLLDIMVVDPIYRKPIGRPNITVILDIYSRMIFGYYVSLEPPSFFTFGQAFYMGVSPKSSYLSRIGIEGDWPIVGLPKNVIIHTDNAREFRGKDIEWFLRVYGIHQEFRPKKKPYFGGHIERFFRTLNEELHKLPGTTFSNPKQKGEYDSESKASFTLDEIEKYIAEWIINVYHVKKHEGIGMAPIEKYKKGILGDGKNLGSGFPDILSPEELKHLKISLLYTEERTITRAGVQINYINYWHEILTNFIGRKEKFIFKIDPRDISRIYFYNPELKIYFEIPCKKLSFPQMSLWELREVIKHLNKENTKNIDEFEILKAYERLKKITEESLANSKKSRRLLATKIIQQNRISTDKTETSQKTDDKAYETEIEKRNDDSPKIQDLKVEVIDW